MNLARTMSHPLQNTVNAPYISYYRTHRFPDKTLGKMRGALSSYSYTADAMEEGII